MRGVSQTEMRGSSTASEGSVQRWRAYLLNSAHRPAVTAIEVVLVAAVICTIQAIVFSAYYGGTASPSGDFLGPYSNESYAWWHGGGLFHPPQWMPYLWGGYPAVASIQNSSWYLPSGVASLFGLDIHVSAVVQALHVALGSLGVYVLGRRLRFGRVASLFGLAAYTFISGFFSNAPYVDFVRGYALAPWVLLCISPLWPWGRRWAVPAAAVLFWQVVVGVYPGMIVALAYGGVVWVALWVLDLRARSREFLIPAVSSAGIGLLLAMPKYLPLLRLQTFQPGDVGDLSVLARSTLGTFLLPAFPGLPGIYSTTSYFVPATVLFLCLLATWKHPGVRAAVVTALFAALFSFPELHGITSALPGMGISRFRMNDFRPLITLGLVVAAMSGTSALVAASHGKPVSGARVRAALMLLLPASMVAFLVVGHFRQGDWIPTSIILCVTTGVVILLVLATSSSRFRGLAGSFAVAAAVCTLTVASGIANSLTQKDLWSIDTVAAQESLWGASSTELIAHAAGTAPMVQRPARSAIAAGASGSQLISPSYNASYYTGMDSVGGYLNVHNSPSFVEARKALEDPARRVDASTLLEAPGIVVGWTAGALPSAADVSTCASLGRCGGITVHPVSYEAGRLAYDISLDVTTRVVANEAYYPGWTALIVDATGRARVVPVTLGPAGLVQMTLPAGHWRMSLVYREPLESLGLWLGAAGLVAAGGSMMRRYRLG